MRRLVAALFAVFLCAPAPAREWIWISPEEIRALPDSGKAWDAMKAQADKLWETPDLSDQDDPENCRVLARAYVYARTGAPAYRDSVIRSIRALPGTEDGGETLALGRELFAYIVAAELVGLPEADDVVFRSWLRSVRFEVLSSKTLISTHEVRPNNWGTVCGPSRVAAALYLGDRTDFDRAVVVFRGWLGNRAAYAGFKYGSLSWQSDPAAPVGINPQGATIQGQSVDGALPEEMRRAGDFRWPPPKENYAWTGLEGAYMQAIILARNGHPDVWQWENRALLRAYKWMVEVVGYAPVGNDAWQTHVVNWAYGTTYAAAVPCDISRAVGFAEWTCAPRAGPVLPSPFTWTASFTPRVGGGWNVLVPPDSTAGTGLTTQAALSDWLAKHPGKP